MGRGQSNIREVQVKTDTDIKFIDELETDEHRIVSICYSPHSPQEEKIFIHKTLSRSVGDIEIFVET